MRVGGITNHLQVCGYYIQVCEIICRFGELYSGVWGSYNPIVLKEGRTRAGAPNPPTPPPGDISGTHPFRAGDASPR